MVHRVRLADAGDAAAIGRLLYDFNREFDEPTPEPAALAERLRQLIAGGDTLVLLAGDGPDGLAVLRLRAAIWSAGLECYLAELYVAPASRGRGLGRALMEAALSEARARGADTMDIGVDEPDLAARRLYESLGFSNRVDGADGPLMFVYERELDDGEAGPGALEAADRGVQDPVGHLPSFGRGQAGERPVETEHRDAVHRRPQHVFKPGTAFGGEHAGGDGRVEGVGEQRERVVGGLIPGSRRLGRRPVATRSERKAKQAGLVEREPEIGGAEGAQPAAGRVGLPRGGAGADVFRVLLQCEPHFPGQDGKRPALDRLDDLLVPGEVVIGGGGGDADPPRHLAERKRVRTALAGHSGGRVDQRVAEIAVMVAIGGPAFGHASILTAFTSSVILSVFRFCRRPGPRSSRWTQTPRSGQSTP